MCIYHLGIQVDSKPIMINAAVQCKILSSPLTSTPRKNPGSSDLPHLSDSDLSEIEEGKLATNVSTSTCYDPKGSTCTESSVYRINLCLIF